VTGRGSALQACSFGGHDNNLNWQVTTSYAEDGKRKTVMQYYDGSLWNRQTVTKDNVTNTTLASETFYDGQGRPAVQVLPAPGLTSVIAYTKNLNLFNGQSQNEDPAKFFDLQPAATPNSLTSPLAATTGAAQYYSASNPEVNDGSNKYIPDAEGYPYTVARYTPDGTGRVMSQSGVGADLKMGSGHETKYYYGGAAQEELDGLFGTEAGNHTHYLKNMVKDANGQMSVSYVDMHGRTVATALAGDAPQNIAALNLNQTQYPNQAGTNITRNLLDNTSTDKDFGSTSADWIFRVQQGLNNVAQEVRENGGPDARSNRSGLSSTEDKILSESKSIINSKKFALIKQAHLEGKSVEVNINGKPIIYQHDYTYSEAMTLHNEGGFLLGPAAFNTKGGGVEHTVLWEVTRLNTQGTGTLGTGQTRTYTDNAQNTAINCYLI
jgi:hypothetical protein